MGITERKERDRQALREKIIAAATEIFLASGIEGTSIRMIADRIEYSPATIYLHFKDKNELLYVIMERAFGHFFKYLSVVKPIEDPMERLHQLGHAYLRFAFEHPSHYSLMFVNKDPMQTHHTDQEWENGERSHALLTETVQECMAKGHFEGHQPEALSLAIWSGVHGLATLKICDRLSMYDTNEADVLVENALKAFNRMLAKA